MPVTNINNRVFYAIEQVAFKDNSTGPTNANAATNARRFITGPMASGVDFVQQRWEIPRGVQSAGMTTNFNLENVFQLGQVELYELSEREPSIEATVKKVLDGAKPIFFMTSDPSGQNNIVGRIDRHRVDMMMTIYPDTQFRATHNPVSAVLGSGMFVSGFTYTYPVDGPCTEEVSFVGNDKVWAVFDPISGITSGAGGNREDLNYPPVAGSSDAPEGIPSGTFGHTDDGENGAFETAGPPDTFANVVVGSGIQRREDVDLRRSVLPRDIPGVVAFNASGIDAAFVNGGFGANGPGTARGQNVLIGNCNTNNVIEHIQTITITANLGREDIFELGTKRPFSRVLKFPLEVTAAIAVITSDGDLVNARALDVGDNTFQTNSIIIRTLDGHQVDIGDANRLQSIEVGGGEAGGSNMTVTYNYLSYNTLNVTHDYYDPNHRVIVFEDPTTPTRFNQGAPPFTRSQFGIW